VSVNESPLIGPPPPEVPLKAAPLIRVIAQVRFPVIASIESREFVGGFQEAIRREYPVLRPQQAQGVFIGPTGPVTVRPSTVWQFSEAKGPWRVSLGPDFLSLEATKYSSRDDFMQRLEQVLQAVHKNFEPAVSDRVGIRYIDRVTGQNLNRLTTLVRTEVGGVLGTPLAEHAKHLIMHCHFVLPTDRGELQGRWGVLPANATVDPEAIEPLAEQSWILDLDAFTAETRDFDVSALVAQARSFAERIYSFFRWAVTDEFLTTYGGQP
jgi:uncharacterized protein (TIGR04255 family)